MIAARIFDTLQSVLAVGDTQPRLIITPDGKHSWGSGTAVADTTLLRTAAGVLSTEALNTRVIPRVNTVTSSATPAINVNTTDMFTITALDTAITSMTSGLTGTPTNGQRLSIRIKGDATPRAITWGASFLASGTVALLATTAASKTHMTQFIYDSTVAKWVIFQSDATGY